MSYSPGSVSAIDTPQVEEHLLLYARIKGVPEDRLSKVSGDKMLQMDLKPFHTTKVTILQRHPALHKAIFAKNCSFVFNLFRATYQNTAVLAAWYVPINATGIISYAGVARVVVIYYSCCRGCTAAICTGCYAAVYCCTPAARNVEYTRYTIHKGEGLPGFSSLFVFFADYGAAFVDRPRSPARSLLRTRLCHTACCCFERFLTCRGAGVGGCLA